MSSKNEIALRPRFKFGINKNNKAILKAFDQAKSNQSHFIITRIDNHLFIRKSDGNQYFWSPQLKIEINAIEENACIVSGFVGPNSTVSYIFMFLNMMIIGLFISFGIWTFTHISLNTSFALQISFMLLMIIIWCLLYFVGRLGKESCNRETSDLYTFMENTIYLQYKPETETNLELIQHLN